MSKKDKIPRLHIDRIAEALLEVQRQFPLINRRLKMHREHLSDEIIQNMLSAYKHLDDLVAEQVKIFSDDGLSEILELNHIVLCGRDAKIRMEYTHHLIETSKRFYDLIQPVKRYYRKHKDSSPTKVASEVYVGILSRPQLFIEGNHRTGALLASYVLLMGGCSPFVLNVDNAVSYFDPSGQIKFSDKRSFKGKFKLPKYEKEFKLFLENNISDRFVLNPQSLKG
ncbi:MAG: hypothetical protein AB1641_17770 [Thermodesulfobacteriota bacterium]